ncbi:ABC transporter ATP-binding protein [Nocardioides abyssi]|uniref:ABC transporter ATP-binding protein n=1 Tax=Nocardioides abyssi TaxID=3058370 RepID=A0ABT8EUG7_9ACTN|nr:ABC transporter ATP-binding protein [Nocardioides abyssi]MDN4161820.1 ABC transporter ATP-binding protein [Nocardioides abyssi]
MAELAPRGIAFEDVRHHFSVGGAAVPALGPVDLRIEPGELVTIAGPSGCGKTTLLRLLAGFLSPSEGEVTVGGRPVDGPAAERGVVFQQPTLFPWLSVRRNVELGPRLRGVDGPARRDAARRYLDLVGLAEFADHRPYELSGGMQQRCQIARVLANEPDIVLMDEPFGALDALTRERLQDELLAIWRSTGRTILFITHSVDEAVFLGSRVLVMSPRPGRIVLDERAVFTDHGERVPAEEIRALPEYVELREEVRRAIAA